MNKVATRKGRTFGIFAPIRSLPTDYCIGTLGKPAYEFIDWLKKARQNAWQIWPFNYSSDTTQFSPYWLGSAFAGNLDLIDPYLLKNDGLIELIPEIPYSERIDYKVVQEVQLKLLTEAFKKATSLGLLESEEFKSFVNENAFWIDDYSFYMAYREFFKGLVPSVWEIPIMHREERAMNKYLNLFGLKDFGNRIEFFKFGQFIFYQQFSKLKSYANQNGIKIIVDMPFYVAPESVDVWQHPELFKVDKINLLPVAIGGCPPDDFSKDGQRWGFPVYNWDYHKKTNFEWFVKRVGHLFKYGDIVRFDHFRGFDQYYEIHACEKTARNGKWVSSPGKELFDAIKKALGPKEIILEDLGTLDEGVYELKDFLGYPGMKVSVWGWSKEGNEHTPSNWLVNSVGYTSTHDSKSVVTSIKEAAKSRGINISEVLGIELGERSIGMAAVEVAYASKAMYVIIPMNDAESSEERFNTPGKVSEENWTLKVHTSPELATEFAELVEKYS